MAEPLRLAAVSAADPGAVAISLTGVSSGARISDLTLSVAKGQRVALLGRNGAGKTTVLRLAAGLLAPASGAARAEGPLGYVAQDAGASLLPWLRVAQNIALPLRGARLSAGDEARQAREAAALLSLDPEVLTRFPYQLSGGEQQRVALARALVGRPRTLLLDEPFAALDAKARVSVRKALASHLVQERQTLVLVTHDLEDVLALANRACLLGGGAGPSRIAADLALDGAPREATRYTLERALAGADL